MASSNKLTPRQKMINLMYIVFLAMLALNVSSDVLNGFKQVEDSLAKSNEGTRSRNEKLYDELRLLKESNPEKASVWYAKATDLRSKTDSLYGYVENLKEQIVRYADGKDADVNNIRRRDNLEATNFIMLSPAMAEGKKLRSAIDSYRETLVSMIPGKEQSVIAGYLSTEIPENGMASGKSWQSVMFENIPVSAAVTILTKMQGDIRNAEGEALSVLKLSVDEGDLRVNRINAFVIPSSKNVMRGSKYSAQIVLAAIDSTQTPDIFVNGKKLETDANGYYETIAGAVGTQSLDGYIEVPRADGSKEQLPFSTSYMVQEPTATVSNTMMNVMYAGIDNPVSISVPGILNSQMNASMSNGTLARSGNGWVAKPTKVGQEAVITVTAQNEGRSVVVANTAFRVRQLPDPMPFIAYQDEKGTARKYKGGTPFSKAYLLKAGGLSAAIDDDLLNVSFRVLAFETVFFDSMGNAIPEISEGAAFSQRQKDALRRLSRGKRFYISRVRAVGPDGVERTLSPIEVIVN
ncbi:MAG: gliding motility protein GldM [Bacteroidales bacterium]